MAELQADHPRAFHLAIGVLLAVSLVGFGVAVVVHFATLVGIDPSTHFKRVWAFQIILFCLLIPIMVELFRKKNHMHILRSTAWTKYVLYTALAYYAANFYVFLCWSVEHLDSRLTWRMFSAGWLLLFSISAVYYDKLFRMGVQPKDQTS